MVDAFVRPEGERLGLATTVAATVFVLLGLAVISGIVAGVADLGPAKEAVSGGRSGRSVD